MATKKALVSKWPAEAQFDGRAICELLKSEQYDRAAEFLEQARISGGQTDNSILADILTIARQICQACIQCHAEATWHQQAYEEVSRREHELRQILEHILDTVGHYEVLELGDPILSQTASEAKLGLLGRDNFGFAERSGILRRIRSLLARRLGPISSNSQERLEKRASAPSSFATADGVRVTASPVQTAKAQNPSSPSLAIHCLGPFRVYLDEQLITHWSGGKGKSIFKYIIANRTRPIAKDILMDLLWPEIDSEAARNNLNVAIYALRQAFREIRPDFSSILFEDEHYLLNPVVTVWVDFEQFEEYYQAGRSLEKRSQVAEAVREFELAEGLYQGDFLEEDLYEDWPILQRESLKDNYLVILDHLSRYHLEAGQYTTCIHFCRKILAKDDCREDVYRRLMRCYNRRGQPNLALRQYHLCSETLSRELDVSPAPETVSLYNQIRHRKAD